MLITQTMLVLSLLSTATAPVASPDVAATEASETDEAGVGLCKRLSCSDNQRIAFLAVRKLARVQLRALEKQHEELRPLLVDAMKQADLTEAEVLALFEDRQTEQRKRHEIVAGTLAKVHKLLHAKQRKQLATILGAEGIEAIIGEQPDRCDPPAG